MFISCKFISCLFILNVSKLFLFKMFNSTVDGQSNRQADKWRLNEGEQKERHGTLTD